MNNYLDLQKRLSKLHDWDAPRDWLRLTAIDMHTAGEPLRVFISGFPEPEGKTILEKRRFVKNNFDNLRTATMWEPRGHADMYGCIITPPENPEADFGVLFLHNEGYSTMCGHAIIALVKLAVEQKLVEPRFPETEILIEAPAGLIRAFAITSEDGSVLNTYFHNVPSFVVKLDAIVDVPELGTVRYDLAFGGAFYAYVDASDFGLECLPGQFNKLVETGMKIKRAIQEADVVVHPFESDLGFLYGTIFIDKPREGGDSRNVCVFAEGEVDRSPTGTGVSGRAAIEYRRGSLEVLQPFVVESILGTRFTVTVLAETTFGDHSAIVPKVEGSAYVTGRNELLIDPNDPLRNGFIFR